MLIAQLEDPEQRAGTVSPCPTAGPNLAILASRSHTDITASLSDTINILQPRLAVDLVILQQKLSVVAFQESKYRKVLEAVGCVLTCSHGNSHVGIQLARNVHEASCQAAGCEMSGQGCLASVCGQPQRGQQPQRRRPVCPFLQDSTLQDAAAPGRSYASRPRGRTGTSAWGAAGLEAEICCCSTGGCCRQHPSFLLFPRD